LRVIVLRNVRYLRNKYYVNYCHSRAQLFNIVIPGLVPGIPSKRGMFGHDFTGSALTYIAGILATSASMTLLLSAQKEPSPLCQTHNRISAHGSPQIVVRPYAPPNTPTQISNTHASGSATSKPINFATGTVRFNFLK
jgi:hypothetical protein